MTEVGLVLTFRFFSPDTTNGLFSSDSRHDYSPTDPRPVVKSSCSLLLSEHCHNVVSDGVTSGRVKEKDQCVLLKGRRERDISMCQFRSYYEGLDRGF